MNASFPVIMSRRHVMTASSLLLLLMTARSFASLEGQDYKGPITVTKVEFDSVRNRKNFVLDLDGDGRPDTLTFFFEQTGYTLAVRYEGHDKYIDYWEALKDDKLTKLEFSVCYLLSPDKPVLVVNLVRGAAMGDSLVIKDIVHTVRGFEAMPLLRKSSGWGDCRIILKPNFIEVKHFRGYTLAKYLWDGDRLVAQPVKEP